jgi:hypothetical protein
VVLRVFTRQRYSVETALRAFPDFTIVVSSREPSRRSQFASETTGNEVQGNAQESNRRRSRRHAVYPADSGCAAPDGCGGRTPHPRRTLAILKRISDRDPKVAVTPGLVGGRPEESRLAKISETANARRAAVKRPAWFRPPSLTLCGEGEQETWREHFT